MTGEVVEIGGYSWVAVDKDDAGVTLVCKDLLFSHMFGISNNWKGSSLRHMLNKQFLYKLFDNGLKKDEIVKSAVDLTTDFGETEYGSSEDFVCLLSCEQYRRYKKMLPPTEQWEWTLTPHTTGCYVQAVRDGFIPCEPEWSVPWVRPVIKINNLERE